jgi:hypothetical protein
MADIILDCVDELSAIRDLINSAWLAATALRNDGRCLAELLSITEQRVNDVRDLLMKVDEKPASARKKGSQRNG